MAKPPTRLQLPFLPDMLRIRSAVFEKAWLAEGAWPYSSAHREVRPLAQGWSRRGPLTCTTLNFMEFQARALAEVDLSLIR